MGHIWRKKAGEAVIEMKNIYRKTAIERLSSPEQLDKPVEILRPGRWLVIVGMILLIIAAILYGKAA